MKQENTGFFPFLRCYHSLIAWGICAVVVLMTFFQWHLPGDLWIIALIFGMLVNLFLVCKNRERYPMPGRFKAFVIVALILSGLFAFTNFFICLWPLMDGSPRIVDGNYILDYKGTVVKYITEQEYHRLKCIEQRLFSGHLLFFYTGTMFLHLQSKLKLQVWTPERIKKGGL
ncbi:MAG: hypothetical protein HDT38_02800 [Clostridiales bacterium]|nr:hypothetical protein [Clostridiales bacterium]